MRVYKERTPWTLLVLFAGIVAVLLALVALGSRGYGDAVARQTQNSAQRATLAYLATRVRAADAQNAVVLADGPEGTALVLRDITENAVYETRIYLYAGQLVEEYAAEGAAYNPQNSVGVADTDTFSAQLDGGMLQLQTGEGSVCVALRAAGGAA